MLGRTWSPKTTRFLRTLFGLRPYWTFRLSRRRSKGTPLNHRPSQRPRVPSPRRIPAIDGRNDLLRLGSHLYGRTALAIALYTSFGFPSISRAEDVQAIVPVESSTPPGSVNTVEVSTFHFKGNTVFSDAQLLSELQAFLAKRKLTDQDIEDARVALSQKYLHAGYVNSGALLPNKFYNVSDRSITFKIVEGRLTDLHIQGNTWLRSSYLSSRIRLAADKPLVVTNSRQNWNSFNSPPLSTKSTPNCAPVPCRVKPS